MVSQAELESVSTLDNLIVEDNQVRGGGIYFEGASEKFNTNQLLN